jgi:hypothetical protein
MVADPSLMQPCFAGRAPLLAMAVSRSYLVRNRNPRESAIRLRANCDYRLREGDYEQEKEQD